jgi:ribose 5-phosphate isomerase B
VNIFIASDHAGFELKNQVVALLQNKNLNVLDLGTKSLDSVDFPDYANLVCEKIKISTSYGILICGSGQGMAIRANKYSHIRAALVYNDEIAKLSREHNDANVICLGSRFCTIENAEKWINIFINTPFSEGRHRQRVDKISQST